MPVSDCEPCQGFGIIVDGPAHAIVCRACHVPIADIIGPGEIRVLAGGVTHRTLKLWREGTNLAGRGLFPLPFKELECGSLWDRRRVQAWLERGRS